MPSSDPEQRIRRLGYAIESLARDVAKAKDDAGALYQMLMAAASLTGQENECPVTITGTVSSSGYLLPIFQMSIEAWYPDNSGTKIGPTVLTDTAGDYTINGFIPSTGTTATIYASKARFVTNTITPTLTCGSFSGADISMSADSGYELTALCGDPFSDSLSLVDTLFGTIAIAYDVVNSWWVGSQVIGGSTITWKFKPNLGAEPGIISVVGVGGASFGTASSTSSTINCANVGVDPLHYSGSGGASITLYPSGTGHWSIDDV